MAQRHIVCSGGRWSLRACKLVFVVGAAIIGICSHAALAGFVYDIDKDPGHVLYGNLDQATVPIFNNAGINVACAPTAAVNSFIYLQNKYPGIYGNKLVGLGQAVAVATKLGDADADPVRYMNTVANQGTFDDDFIYGKWRYLENVAPGLTVYEAQSMFGWINPPIPQPNWVQNRWPTWDFLWKELTDCEDVEILVEYEHSSGGHALTLKSFHWNDANGNGTIEQLEATIDFIDPCGGAAGQCNVWQDLVNGWLDTNYGGGAFVKTAVSESPVPLPAAFWPSLMGIACLAARRRRAA